MAPLASPLPIYNQSIKIKSSETSKLMSQFYSIVHEEKFYKIRYASSENRPKKYPAPPIKYQELSKSKQLSDSPQKIPYEFPVKNFQLLSDASKSETFIHPHSRLSLSRLEKDRVGLKKVNSKYTDWKQPRPEVNEFKTETELSEGGDKSLQQLLAPKPNNYKTQYSKIARRKETIIKRNLVIDDCEKIELKNSRCDPFSEDKLIEKYRELMQQNRPLNLINRLYQHDILLTKLMPLSTKQKLIISNLNHNQKEIEERINKIISKPSEYDTIRKMLLTLHDKVEEEDKYPYQTNNALTKNESELIDLRDTAKFSSLNSEKKEHHRRSMAIHFNRNKQLRPKAKDEPISLPRKIESDSHLNPPAEKDVFPPPKKLSCAAYIIYEVHTPTQQKLLRKVSVQLPKKRDYQSNLHSGANIKIASQIASLTKIMTCVVVIEVCERLSINPLTERYKTGSFESFIRGTSAEIEPGEIYSVHQLLHGLMLPSGNDASLALARWAGNVLLLSDNEAIRRSVPKPDPVKFDPYSWALQNKYLKSEEERLRPKRCYNRFIAEMNKRARLLGMDRTNYANSHGLSNNLNRSCCLDLALLCQHAMQNQYFRQIVACKHFTASIDKEVVITALVKPKPTKSECLDPEELNLEADAEDRDADDHSECEEGEAREEKGQRERRVEVEKKEVRWVNTHRLLHEREQYIGIKTGVTVTAGPCLASWLSIKDRNFIIIVLNSKKLSLRFTDTEILRQWVSRKEKLKCAPASKLLAEQGNTSSSDDSS